MFVVLIRFESLIMRCITQLFSVQTAGKRLQK